MEERIAGNWIAVADRLPTEDALYLVYAASADPSKPLIATAWFDPSGFGWSLLAKYWIDAITHWMPLPMPPPPTPKIESDPTMQFLIDRAWEILSPMIDDAKLDYVLKVHHAATAPTQAGAAPKPTIGGSVGSQSDSENG